MRVLDHPISSLWTTEMFTLLTQAVQPLKHKSYDQVRWGSFSQIKCLKNPKDLSDDPHFFRLAKFLVTKNAVRHSVRAPPSLVLKSVMKTMIGLEGMVLSLDFSCCSLAAKESWYLLIPKKYKQSKGPPKKKKKNMCWWFTHGLSSVVSNCQQKSTFYIFYILLLSNNHRFKATIDCS